MTSATSATELVDLAEAVAALADRRLGTSRHLAAALLLRQAVETAIDAIYDTHAPGLGGCSSRAELACLPFFVDDTDLSHDAAYCWHRLTRACHHDEYDLPPSAREIEHLAGIARRLAECAATSPSQVPAR